MSSKRKKIRIVLLFLVAIFVAINLIFFGFFYWLKTSKGEKYVKGIIISTLQKQLKTKIDIGEISINFPNSASIKDLSIYDLDDSLMINIGKLDVKGIRYNFINQNINIYNLAIKDLFFNLNINGEDTSSNFTHFYKKLLSKSSTKKNKGTSIFKCFSLDIENTHFIYDNFNKKNIQNRNQIDWEHLDIKSNDIDISYLIVDGDNINANLNKIDLVDKSGFVLNNLNAKYSMSDTFIKVLDFTIKTPNSRIKDNFSLLFNKFSNFSSFYDSVQIVGEIEKSIVSFKDLSFFTSNIENKSDSFTVSGLFTGPLSSIGTNNLNLKWQNNTNLNGEIRFKGLPYTSKINISSEFNNSSLSFNDFQSLFPSLPLPKELFKAGIINFNNKFNGSLLNFSTSGVYLSDLGSLDTDLNIKLRNDYNIDSYDGNVNFKNFKIQNLLDSDLLKDITGTIEAKGTGSNFSELSTTYDLKIKSLHFRNYNYKNLGAKGVLDKRNLNISLASKDSNLNFLLFGNADLSEKNPKIDFITDVSSMNLKELGFTKDTLTIKGFAKMKFQGSNIDSIFGSISAESLQIKTPKKLILTDSISLVSSLNENLDHNVSFYSNSLKANIVGKFKFKNLPLVLNNIISSYTESEFFNFTEGAVKDQVFSFNVEYNNIEYLINQFYPQIKVENGGFIKGKVNSNSNLLVIESQIPGLGFNKFFAKGINININSAQNELNGITSIKNITNDSINLLEEITFKNKFNKNNIQFVLDAKAKEFSTNGHLEGNINLLDNNAKVDFSNSLLKIKDSLWEIQNSNFNINNKGEIAINKLEINHLNESMVITGSLNNDTNNEDNLRLIVNGLDLENVGLFEPSLKDFKGKIDGQFTLRNVFNNPYIDAGLNIGNFAFKNDTIGNLSVFSYYNTKQNKVFISTSLMDEIGFERASANGNIGVDNKHEVNFNLFINKSDLAIIEPLTFNNLSDIKGYFSANASIKGTLKEPKIKGKLLINAENTKVNYLGTNYSFLHTIDIEQESLNISNMKIKDSLGNTMVVNGKIDIFDEKNNLDLKAMVESKSFMFLNTSKIDNDIFFGTVLASGEIEIKGAFNEVNLDMKMKTQKGTMFNLPIENENSYSEASFIKFKEIEVETIKTEKKSSITNLNMKLDLEVTPEAFVKIIIDPTTEDIIEGNGSGNLSMNLSSSGDFSLRGKYSVEKGTYQITLYDILKRKFDIKQGSSITWNGDAYKGIVDVVAVYQTSASSRPLLESSNQNTSSTIGGVSSSTIISYPVYDVNAYLLLKGNLLQPDISFDFELLNTGAVSTTSRLNNASGLDLIISNIKNDEQQLATQVASLIMFKSFAPYSDASSDLSPTINAEGSVGTLLSNQLNNLISKYNQDVQVGVDVRGQEQFRLTLDATLLNDKIKFGGAYDINTQNYNAQIMANLNKSQTINAKLFNRSNNNPILSQTSNTIGGGVVFRKEFDKISDFFKKKKSDATKEEEIEIKSD
jgi:hypothetical protein